MSQKVEKSFSTSRKASLPFTYSLLPITSKNTTSPALSSGLYGVSKERPDYWGLLLFSKQALQ